MCWRLPRPPLDSISKQSRCVSLGVADMMGGERNTLKIRCVETVIKMATDVMFVLRFGLNFICFRRYGRKSDDMKSKL